MVVCETLHPYAAVCGTVLQLLLVTSVLKKQCSLDEANLVGPWPVLACKGFFTRAVGARGAGAGGAGAGGCNRNR